MRASLGTWGEVAAQVSTIKGIDWEVQRLSSCSRSRPHCADTPDPPSEGKDDFYGAKYPEGLKIFEFISPSLKPFDISTLSKLRPDLEHAFHSLNTKRIDKALPPLKSFEINVLWAKANPDCDAEQVAVIEAAISKALNAGTRCR